MFKSVDVALSSWTNVVHLLLPAVKKQLLTPWCVLNLQEDLPIYPQPFLAIVRWLESYWNYGRLCLATKVPQAYESFTEL